MTLGPDNQRLIETVRDHADALADIAVGWCSKKAVNEESVASHHRGVENTLDLIAARLARLEALERAAQHYLDGTDPDGYVNLHALLYNPPVRRAMSDFARHRIQVKVGAVTVVRERIERRLGVETSTRPEGGVWAIYFDAPADVDLDFLRPDVLPPKETGDE